MNITKSGNSLVIRIPPEIAKFTNIHYKDMARVKQIEKLSKFALSEIAWTRAKELELKLANPILYFETRRVFNSILSRLGDLDKNMSITKEEEYKGIIREIDEVYSKFKEERVKSLASMLYQLLVVGIMIVTAIYTLVAMKYITMDKRVPLIIGSGVIIFILLAMGFNIFAWFKLLFNVLKERKFLVIFLILLLIMALSPAYLIYKNNQKREGVLSCLSQITSNESISPEVKEMITEDIDRIKQQSFMFNTITSMLILIPLLLIITLPYAKGGKGVLVFNKLSDVEKQNF